MLRKDVLFLWRLAEKWSGSWGRFHMWCDRLLDPLPACVFFQPLYHSETLPLSSSSFFILPLNILAAKNHTLETFNNAPDDAPDMPQMMPQTCPRWWPRHAPDDALDMPQMMPQMLPQTDGHLTWVGARDACASKKCPRMPVWVRGERGCNRYLGNRVSLYTKNF